MVTLKGNCKQALFCVSEYIPYTWVMLSPMETKEPGRAKTLQPWVKSLLQALLNQQPAFLLQCVRSY